MSDHTPEWFWSGASLMENHGDNSTLVLSVATAPSDTNAAKIAAAPILLEGATAGLAWLEDMLQDIYEAHCLLDADLNPRKDTLDECAKDDVANLEEVIGNIKAAIAKATGAA